ncbi:transcriptional regulator [Geminocystis sp. NIES-3708]|uniref:TetR/AcrR family transcriptional regulator n=1 Tax=Geminocystis sp. NIES-3708 TaxID=1615909 RepID=UPI0005FC499E|nr:TetR/AcrR family transcriptional regulator [Geminocystis sp. NIES-3708]BAQ60150.1 transcriptional regulator [Geminocystis sp. NIES-3708]
MAKETYIPCLLELFRKYGYDGATLSKISKATGLGKASLYHHFPGGKDEMMKSVLDFLEQWLEQYILPCLRQQGDSLSKLKLMGDRLWELYEGGEQPCLFAILLSGTARDLFHDQVKKLFLVWIETMSQVFIEEGIDELLAREKAEDVAISIQGSLILSQAFNSSLPFQRIIKQLSI